MITTQKKMKCEERNWINKIPFLFIFFSFSFFIFLSSFVNATTLYGNVYGPDLNLLKNSLITINSTPAQNYVAINGNYSFELPLGIYEITAMYKGKDLTLKSKDLLIVNHEGEFVYDLILFDIEDVENINFDEKALIEQTIEESSGFSNEINLFLFLFVFLLIIVIIFIVIRVIIFKKFKKKSTNLKKEKKRIANKRLIQITNQKKLKKDFFLESEKISSDETMNKIYSIVKKEKRINQKDIRKQIGMSEAKISLIISDLEARGLIKRIKVGRGNIILLKE